MVSKLLLSPDHLFISEHSEFEINYSEAVEQANVITFLVAHKEFKDSDIKTDSDFCEV